MKPQNRKFKPAALFCCTLKSELKDFYPKSAEHNNLFLTNCFMHLSNYALWPTVQNHLDKILIILFSYISSTNPFYFWPMISSRFMNINYDQNNSGENLIQACYTEETHNKDEMQKEMSLNVIFSAKKHPHILLLRKRTREKKKED